jgi:hypothetical protein
VLMPIPRLTTGAAVAVQTAQNAAVTEVDPVTTSTAPPVGTVAGQVDMSRQLFEFSRPGMDAVISEDLGRAYGTALDAQIVNGSGTAGQLRGFLNVSGILTVTGVVTSVQAFVSKVWDAYNQLSSTSGFGTPDPAQYLTILHPRRYAWLHGGSGSTTVPVEPRLPGQVVVSGGIPVNLGAGTNEDVALVVEKTNVVLVGGTPTIRVFEDVGSGTLTVRINSWLTGALLVKHPAAVARITSLTPPTF